MEIIWWSGLESRIRCLTDRGVATTEGCGSLEEWMDGWTNDTEEIKKQSDRMGLIEFWMC